jgi:hypothetical protein
MATVAQQPSFQRHVLQQQKGSCMQPKGQLRASSLFWVRVQHCDRPVSCLPLTGYLHTQLAVSNAWCVNAWGWQGPSTSEVVVVAYPVLLSSRALHVSGGNAWLSRSAQELPPKPQGSGTVQIESTDTVPYSDSAAEPGSHPQ